MNDKQRKAVRNAFELLLKGAKAGMDMVDAGEDPKEIHEHLGDIKSFVGDIEESLSLHLGASELLKRVEAQRAKTIGRPRTS